MIIHCPHDARTLLLSKGEVALLDADDFEKVGQFSWTLWTDGKRKYAYRKKNGKNIYLHREITQATNKECVDHINGNGLDNRKENLRVVTNQQNAWNSRYSRGVSKYRGVCRNGKNRWRAQIRILGNKRIHIGTFKSEEEAATAYQEFSKKYHGAFSCQK